MYICTNTTYYTIAVDFGFVPRVNDQLTKPLPLTQTIAYIIGKHDIRK